MSCGDVAVTIRADAEDVMFRVAACDNEHSLRENDTGHKLFCWPLHDPNWFASRWLVTGDALAARQHHLLLSRGVDDQGHAIRAHAIGSIRSPDLATGALVVGNEKRFLLIL